MNEHQPQAFSTDPPTESLYRPLLHRTGAVEVKTLVDEVEQRLATELKRTAEASQALRSAARRDAMIVVAREMERRGQPPTCWTDRDAEAAREIAEILIDLDSQDATPPDRAFASSAQR